MIIYQHFPIFPSVPGANRIDVANTYRTVPLSTRRPNSHQRRFAGALAFAREQRGDAYASESGGAHLRERYGIASLPACSGARSHRRRRSFPTRKG